MKFKVTNITCVILQYNEELHYVEPCLNGTLVQADVTNKDVSISLFHFFSTLWDIDLVS